MTCTEIRRYLSDYLEGTLAPEQAQQVERHLQTCITCAQECRALEWVPLLLGQWSPPVPSEQIWAGIEARLRAGSAWQVAPTERTSRLPWRVFTRWLPAATLAAVAVSALIALFVWRAQPTYLPLNGSYSSYWQAHRQWARSGGTSELYPYVEAQ
ncbi:hypothetical protein HRbin15_00903 [bacterium HR15]|nr:hypothetical protein HRbin15_00903 [bacterium HR15]